MPPLQEELRQTQAHAVLTGSCRCGRRLTLFCRELSEQNSFATNFFPLLSEQAHTLRCRGYFISSFCRESPGNVPFWHVMPWSLHFIFRGGPEKKRSKEKEPPARRKIRGRPVRPAPTPGPLILTLTFPIHFDDHIKRITRLRTSPIHSPASAPSGHNGKHPRMAPKGPTRPHRLRSTINKICESASPAIERKACRDGPKGGRHDFPQMHIYPFLPSGFAVCERKRGLLACVRTA